MGTDECDDGAIGRRRTPQRRRVPTAERVVARANRQARERQLEYVLQIALCRLGVPDFESLLELASRHIADPPRRRIEQRKART